MAGEGQVRERWFGSRRSERHDAGSEHSLAEAWEEQAENWIRWARTPDFDSYWRFHGEQFRRILPAPGRLTVDLGCGEGRVSRDLIEAGHRVVALDRSPTLVRAAATEPVAPPVVLADVARLPLLSDAADLAVAFMSLQDVDDWEAAIGEAARVLEPGGRLCLAVVHPINSAGTFEGDREDPDAPFVVTGSYLEPHSYSDELAKLGMEMTFHSHHRPLEHYTAALAASGFVIEELREPTVEKPGDHWNRLPLFLHLLARLDRAAPTGSAARATGTLRP